MSETSSPAGTRLELCAIDDVAPGSALKVEAGDLTYGRQQFAVGKLATGNQAAQLLDDLPIDRLAGAGLNVEQ